MSDREPDIDLDEDLFDFEEILDRADEESEKIDLEELLKVLESSPQPAGGARREEPLDDDAEIGAAAATRAREAAPELRPATPAPEPRTAGVLPQDSAAAVPAGISGRFARVTLTIIAGLALLNVVSVGLSWERGRDVSTTLQEMERRFLETTGDLRQELFHQSAAMERKRLPVVAPSGEAAGLEAAAALIERGEFAAARRRIYSLLAVVDRYEPETREELEGLASYLVADSWMAEARDREATP